VYPLFAQPSEARHAIQEIYCRRLENPDTVALHRSNRYPPVRSVRCCCTSVFGSSVLSLWINQGNQ
jgi:hypothetical protein